MSHALLEHRAVLALCRRAAWIGDWRKFCVRYRTEFDGERFNQDRGYDRMKELPQFGEPGYEEAADDRRKIFEPYRLEWTERDIRLPPLPFKNHGGGQPNDGCCCVCNQPIYAKRFYRNIGPRHASARWHAICYRAYLNWTAHSYSLPVWLAARQRGLCALSGQAVARYVELHPNDWRRGKRGGCRTHEWRLLPDVQIDHVIPLWKVAGLIVSWPRVLNYWGPGNLQLVTETAHKDKCRQEARERARLRLSGQEVFL